MEDLQNKLVFLSNPYSHKDETIVNQRYEKCLKLFYDLMYQHDIDIISPIIIGHPIVKKFPMPSDWTKWEKFCCNLIDHSDVVLVFKLEGWDISNGVAEEIAYAKQNNKQILYITEDLILSTN